MPKPLFQPSLVNGPQGDPVVYVDFQFARRAMLFDLGDIRRLPPRKVLRLTDVLVSHAHLDHFNDFAWLIRLTLGRAMHIRLYGPPGFIDRVEHGLQAFTWNLVDNYEEDVQLTVIELHPDERGRRADFRCRERFARRNEQWVDLPGNLLWQDEAVTITGVLLDHGDIHSLAWAVQEARHVNIWKNRLAERGLGTGPWLSRLKAAVLAERPDDERICAEWPSRDGLHREWLTLGELRREIVSITPGQKVAYVVDCGYTAANRQRIRTLIQDARTLFIEAPFRHEEAERALARGHLTAHQAGRLAGEAGVVRLVPMHFSPRYPDAGEKLEREAQHAFRARNALGDAGRNPASFHDGWEAD